MSRGPWFGVLHLNAELRVAVVRALALYRRHLRFNGMRVPPGFDELTAMLDASPRPEPTQFGATIGPPDPELVNYTEAGRRLGGVSTRTVERLIAAGQLEKVRVGRRALVRLADVRELGANRAG